jgi:hypothetical protein
MLAFVEKRIDSTRRWTAPRSSAGSQPLDYGTWAVRELSGALRVPERESTVLCGPFFAISGVRQLLTPETAEDSQRER